MKQHPFSLYDFIGYFIPGAILIYMVFIITAIKAHNPITIDGIINLLPSIKAEGVILALILSYVMGHLLSFISSITVEKYAVWKYGFPSRYLLSMKTPKYIDHFKTFKGFFWGALIFIILLPTTLLDLILGRWFGFKDFYVRPLDGQLSKVILFKINQLVRCLGITEANGFKKGEGSKSDFFRIVQHYTYDHSKCHQTKFANYVALYGFLRNMTLIINVLFWYFIVHSIIINDFKPEYYWALIITSLLSYTFFMAYMKFYRRYTLEGFMVLVIDKDVHD